MSHQIDENVFRGVLPEEIEWNVLPGGTAHFHWARAGEYVTQVTAIGPLGLEYLDPADDPRAA